MISSSVADSLSWNCEVSSAWAGFRYLQQKAESKPEPSARAGAGAGAGAGASASARPARGVPRDR